MSGPSISYQELEALHDVLEAARCFWHPQQHVRTRAEEALRLVNQMFWRLGEQLPKTGSPTSRFAPVMFSSQGTRVDQIVGFVDGLQREYTAKHDPWWADTVQMAEAFADELSDSELRQLDESLQRLGLFLEVTSDLKNRQMCVGRQDIGPWAAEVAR